MWNSHDLSKMWKENDGEQGITTKLKKSRLEKIREVVWSFGFGLNDKTTKEKSFMWV